MITKRFFVVHYYVQILFISDRQFAQLLFLFYTSTLDVYTRRTFLHVSSRSTHHQEVRKFVCTLLIFIHRRLLSRMDLWPPFSGFLDHTHTDTR
jgi:hypothetical protein